MKNEVIEKAYEKAATNGWERSNEGGYQIFSHAFAKAFWGRELINTILPNPLWKNPDYPNAPKHAFFNVEAWQYHLRQMVVEEDPSKYLEKFLKR